MKPKLPKYLVIQGSVHISSQIRSHLQCCSELSCPAAPAQLCLHLPGTTPEHTQQGKLHRRQDTINSTGKESASPAEGHCHQSPWQQQSLQWGHSWQPPSPTRCCTKTIDSCFKQNRFNASNQRTVHIPKGHCLISDPDCCRHTLITEEFHREHKTVNCQFASY